MSDEIRQLSLFSPTSAFVPPEIPTPEEIADRLAPAPPAPRPDPRLTRTEELVGAARDALTSVPARTGYDHEEVLDLLDQALEELRRA